jgi:catechol 2,3-dioxygenase-like lactoylglutathione lyase family enzyme
MPLTGPPAAPRRFTIALAIALVAASSSALLSDAAQQPAEAPPAAGPGGLSVSILHLNVANLDRSLALYRDALGFEVTTAPGAPRASAQLVSEPGAMIRIARVKAPAGPFVLELVEWTGTPLRQQQARIQDPGATMLAINVSDIDAKLAAMRQHPGVTVLTAGGRPYVSTGRGGENRAVMLRDENGFVIELVQNAGAQGPASTVAVYLTVTDLAQTVNFYNKVIGFSMMPPAAAQPTSERVQQLFDNRSLKTMRTARGTFPGSSFVINFQEFGGLDRKSPLRHRVQDPGGPILTMTVNEFAAVMAAVKANGGIVGQGESSETLAADARAAWVRDPNGLLIRMSAPNPGRGRT